MQLKKAFIEQEGNMAMFFSGKSKRLFFGAIFMLISHGLFAEGFNNHSISLDPLSGLGFLLSGFIELDIRNIAISADVNWETANQREVGIGALIRGDRLALRTHYRFFHNRERLSGFFWGVFGLAEWRRMYWFHNENSEIDIGWFFPFHERNNTYHSVGITGGLDVGFRIRRNNLGVTPFFRAGIPLFYIFGDAPSQLSTWEFYRMNILPRAVSVGFRLDFFDIHR